MNMRGLNIRGLDGGLGAWLDVGVFLSSRKENKPRIEVFDENPAALDGRAAALPTRAR